ncbi:caspase family protein [Roseovarius ramblicola]|uniref:Caspase domain-containing protein n=1 Tax=Roseovarius ramblicola TaxID=2022336 RepID=A0ABV5I5F0_9RHOB
MTARHITGFRHCRPGAAMRAMILGAALIALALGAGAARAEGPRMALVVGNADYDALAAMPQAARGARDIAALLERQEFEVSLLLNSDRATFSAAFDSFASRAADAGMVLFYFAGHGLRADGVNRLAAIDLVLDDPGTAATAGLALAPLIDRLASGTRPAVIVLDAARRFDLAPPVAARVAPGLGVPAPAREAMVVMATQPGSLVPGETGAGFTLELGDALTAPGQPLEPLLQDLAARVSAASNGRQAPWVRSSLSEPLFLRPFRPDEEDFARLAAMPEAQQTFLLDIWRDQGARLDPEVIARHLGAPGDGDGDGDGDGNRAGTDAAAAAPEDAGDTAAPAVPRFTFDFIEDEEQEAAPPAAAAAVAAPPAPVAPVRAARARPAPAAPATSGAALPPPETPAPETPVPAAVPDTPGAVTVAALTARAAQNSPAVADTPIARIGASQDSLVLASLDPGRALRPAPGRGQRIIGEDVTDRFFAPDDLPRAVQTELARLGCYRAGVDGIWGNGSRGALREYIARSGADLDARNPTEAVWRHLKSATGTVCPAPVARAPEPAPAGGGTAARAPEPAREPAPAAAPAAPAAGGIAGEQLRGALRGAFR